MNSIDLKNIKEVIKYRELVEKGPKFNDEDSTMTLEQLNNTSIKELKKMVSDFENNVTKNNTEEFKKIVDEIFEKWGTERDNMIVLSVANVFDNYATELSDPLGNIEFDAVYNRASVHPVGCEFDGLSYWQRSEASDEELAMWDKKIDAFSKDIKRLLKAADKLRIKTAEKYWDTEGNLSSLNKLWHGVIAVKKNYDIVSFVIPNDGIMIDGSDIDIIKTI